MKGNRGRRTTCIVHSTFWLKRSFFSFNSLSCSKSSTARDLISAANVQRELNAKNIHDLTAEGAYTTRIDVFSFDANILVPIAMRT